MKSNNKIYIKRSTKTGIVRWAVVNEYKRGMIDKGEFQLKNRRQLKVLLQVLKDKYQTTTAYQLLTIE